MGNCRNYDIADIHTYITHLQSLALLAFLLNSFKSTSTKLTGSGTQDISGHSTNHFQQVYEILLDGSVLVLMLYGGGRSSGVYVPCYNAALLTLCNTS